MVVKVGTASDGDILPQTSGYENHKYFVSPREGDSASTQSSGYEIRGAGAGITCYVDQSTRKVTAKIHAAVQRNISGSPLEWESSSMSINYMEIAY